MSIAQAETLKHELTDKYVVVSDVPELRRFEGLTGQVKTVNMNGRALVQFNGAVDISWYDIDPNCLTIVDKPLPKKKEEAPAKKAAPKAAKPKAGGGKSPLELAREQGAGGGAASGEKKLSPLELARQQGAAGAKPASSEKKLSPLELARQQGAAGSKSEDSSEKLSPLEQARQQGAAKAEAPATPEPEAVEEATPEPVEETPAPAPAASSSSEKPGTTAEIIALAKEQGAFKG